MKRHLAALLLVTALVMGGCAESAPEREEEATSPADDSVTPGNDTYPEPRETPAPPPHATPPEHEGDMEVGA